MKDETIKKYIDMAVKRTIEELKKNGMIKEIDAAAYGDASEMLKTYFLVLYLAKNNLIIIYLFLLNFYIPYYLWYFGLLLIYSFF